jgi:nucleoside-triphosphatase THEP1
MSLFKKAVIEQSKVRVALWGSSGSGKTRTSLEIASGLGQKIAVIDTEHGRSRHYADRYSFDVVELSNFHPNQYIQAIQAAEDGGYDVLIIDSLTHAWSGEGGLLETHANIVRRSSNKNEFTAWEEVTPMHRRLVEAILRSSLHIIVTMRAKTEYAMEVNESGKTIPRKVGLGPEQRKGIEYEFDIIGYMDQDHTLTIEKDTSDLLQDQVIKLPTAELGMQLEAWFSRGDRPEWNFTTFHRDILMKAKVAQRWERTDTATLLDLYGLNRLEDIPDERTYQQIRQVLSFAPQAGLERAQTLLSLKLQNRQKLDTSGAKQSSEAIAG